jgi:hypothetical protein
VRGVGAQRFRRTWLIAVLAGVAVASTLVWPWQASAKSAVTVPYPFGEVWPAAIRLLRVDRGYVVREKDEASGYVLFDVPEAGRTYRAALELVATSDAEGRPATQILCSMSELPRHHENTLLERLQAKVRAERGVPAPPPRARPKSSDGGVSESQRRGNDAGAPPASPSSPTTLPRAPVVTP